MTTEEFLTAIDLAQSSEEDGWRVLQERTMSVHVARGGVGLNVTRVDRIRLEGAHVQLGTQRGELSVVALADVFALSLDAAQGKGRKAGFV